MRRLRFGLLQFRYRHALREGAVVKVGDATLNGVIKAIDANLGFLHYRLQALDLVLGLLSAGLRAIDHANDDLAPRGRA